MVMLEKFRESRDRRDEFGALFTDLSKAFDCIDHNLLITKLSLYGVTTKSLNLFFSYLINRMQSVRINNNYSNKHEIMYGVSQGSVLGPLLFNILVDTRCRLNVYKTSIRITLSAPYSLRDKNEHSRNPKTVTYGTESISFFGTQNLAFNYLK